MEEPNEPLACNVDGGRRGGAGSSRSNDDDSSVSMPESGSSAGSEHGGNDGMNAPPNGHMAGGILPDLPLHPPMLGASQLKRRPVSPADDPRRPPKRPKHGTSTMLLSLMQVGVEEVTTVCRLFFYFLSLRLISTRIRRFESLRPAVYWFLFCFCIGHVKDRRGTPKTATRTGSKRGGNDAGCDGLLLQHDANVWWSFAHLFHQSRWKQHQQCDRSRREWGRQQWYATIWWQQRSHSFRFQDAVEPVVIVL